jgi:hypothetical protein
MPGNSTQQLGIAVLAVKICEVIGMAGGLFAEGNQLRVAQDFFAQARLVHSFIPALQECREGSPPVPGNPATGRQVLRIENTILLLKSRVAPGA